MPVCPYISYISEGPRSNLEDAHVGRARMRTTRHGPRTAHWKAATEGRVALRRLNSGRSATCTLPRGAYQPHAHTEHLALLEGVVASQNGLMGLRGRLARKRVAAECNGPM